MNIKDNFQDFSTTIVKKLFGNTDNAKSFLLKFSEKTGISIPKKQVTRGKLKGTWKIDLSNSEIFSKIVEIWRYEPAKDIVRDIFKQTKKYKSGKDSYETMNILLEEWENLHLGDITRPFSQGDFDGFVQRVNSEYCGGYEKDKKVKEAAVKYRRIKEINTVRNDFIETLIFEKNENIIPTLNHSRGVDFFINGQSFDQKVSKSPTEQFKKYYGENRKQEAIKHPDKVAEYLYKYQDEGRFGADSRLLVVYLDEDISINRIAKIINDTDLLNPIDITFEYTHNKGKPTEKKQTYRVKCFVILLYN